MTTESASQLLRPAEAAKLLAISERSLWTMTNRKLVPHVRIGRSVRYSQAALAEWIESQTTTAACSLLA